MSTIFELDDELQNKTLIHLDEWSEYSLNAEKAINYQQISQMKYDSNEECWKINERKWTNSVKMKMSEANE